MQKRSARKRAIAQTLSMVMAAAYFAGSSFVYQPISKQCRDSAENFKSTPNFLYAGKVCIRRCIIHLAPKIGRRFPSPEVISPSPLNFLPP